MKPVASWGRLSSPPHEVISLNDIARAPAAIRAGKPGIAHGMGRSYGDVALNPGGILWHTTGLDRLIGFDRESGRLHCEAGILLRDIQRLALRCGWDLPVTPGTQMVTVGGAIANDVHGKNHHRRGSFGNHILRLRVARTDGEIIECSPDSHGDFLAATIGGLGLTGLILEAEIQLQRSPGPWFDAETIPYHSLDEFFALASDAEQDWEHTVSWIDCLAGREARGIFIRANPSSGRGATVPRPRRARAVPVTPPFSLVNGLSLRLFNTAYFQLQKYQAGRRLVHFEKFLYPLDAIHDWNRIYGPRGFYQHQCVIPQPTSEAALRSMLSEIARDGTGSFLAVLKTFGEREAPGLLSFAKPGATLALDFPNRGGATLDLLDRLDAIVLQAGGRIYPAKDARMSPATFAAGYPRLPEFIKFRDPGISSAMSRRLLGS